MSKKQLMDMALDSNGIGYVCNSIANGWGISPDEICKRFSSFINDKYISQQKGYTSKMYCKYNGYILANTTLIAVINSDVNITLTNSICQVYCTGKGTKIHLIGTGQCDCYCYGDKEDVEIVADDTVRLRITQKEKGQNDG